MISYSYDETGFRTRKGMTGTQTWFDRDAAGNLVHETRNNGKDHLYYYYDANGSIGSISYNGVRYAFRKNLQGDVIAILDTSGNVVARYTYDAWGKVLSVTDADGNANTSSTFIGNVNPIRYRGYYYDTETGWYYLNSRYYDPEVKRFINEDAYLGTDKGTRYNLFTYCGNNPVMYVDPNGSMVIVDDILIILGIGVISLFTIGAVSALTNSFPTEGTGALQPSYRDNIIDLDKYRNPLPSPIIPPVVGTDVIPPPVPEPAPEDNKIKYEEGMYYGVDLRGRTWNVKTGPMTKNQAQDWVYTTHLAGIYGKGTSWGVYTPHHDDAWSLAYRLGNYKVPLIHENRSGEYDHFHVNGKLLYGVYKHFHVWFGSLK